ncbi:MAG: lytic murein transglycosylase B [Stenotrophomonas koreensis]
MKFRALACLASLSLVACATGDQHAPAPVTRAVAPVPATSTTPAEAAPESAQALPPVEDWAHLSLEQQRERFIAEAAAAHRLDPAVLHAGLAQAQIKPAIISAMSRPAERVKPWHEYRPMFISQARIDGGRQFLAEHRQELARVEQQTGVPAQVIVAIIGVETSYGRNTGSHRVLDALYTLAFNYPRSGDPAKLDREIRRAAFFRDELARLFVLARDEQLDLMALQGSYAGAMGMGQFMPSSYLDFAVDGDGDGRRDLFTSRADVFASIANYFVRKGGWQRGGLIAVPATLAEGHAEFNPEDWTPRWSQADLAQRGYRARVPVPAAATATPISLEGAAGKQYWLGYQNYYAITRYNISKMYAMAVFQLSEAIAGQELPSA